MFQPFTIELAENAVCEFFTRLSADLQPCLLMETHANGGISLVSAAPITIRLNKRMTSFLTKDTATIVAVLALLSSHPPSC